jgi:hypothetical protein
LLVTRRQHPNPFNSPNVISQPRTAAVPNTIAVHPQAVKHARHTKKIAAWRTPRGMVSQQIAISVCPSH